MSDTTTPNTVADATSVPVIVPPPLAASLQRAANANAAPETAPLLAVSQSDADSPKLFRQGQIQSCLVSTIVHLIALLIFAIVTYSASQVSPTMISLWGRQVEPTATVTLEVAKDHSELENQLSSDAEKPVDVTIAQSDASAIQSPLIMESQSAILESSELGQIKAGSTAASSAQLIRLPGGGLSGRTPQGRKELGEKYGATAQSEAAVEAALQWLALHQRPNGSWSFNLDVDPCNGRCRHSRISGDSPTPSTGATGLALLAFLGAGHTHHTGEHSETVRRGIYYLRGIASESEHGLDWQSGSMYSHGIVLMALGEALTMTRVDDKYDSDLMDLVRRGSYFTSVAQHYNGSWGYVPGSPGDTTLTGWQVMSLLAAKRNGIHFRGNELPMAKEFLMSVKEETDWTFGYKTPQGEPTMDAIALTLLLYLGHAPGHTLFDQAIDRIADRGPTLTNVYHDYYASLALHHTRHRDWDKFNSKLRDHLVRSQATQGHESGSWHFKDKWGDVGGRLYTTAMSAMILEIYYRYLPLYDKIEEFPL
ncbi:prenyltransferase/squalene oxidase repeat-containing protein [Planctomycetes bacterium K23_9]